MSHKYASAGTSQGLDGVFATLSINICRTVHIPDGKWAESISIAV